MNSYLKITVCIFTIWLSASFINGVLCCFSSAIAGSDFTTAPGDCMVVFLVSLFFSIPGFFIFWVLLMSCFSRYQTRRPLFRSALTYGFILSAVTGYWGSIIFSAESFLFQRPVICSCIISSAMISIMLHFKYFKTIK